MPSFKAQCTLLDSPESPMAVPSPFSKSKLPDCFAGGCNVQSDPPRSEHVVFRIRLLFDRKPSRRTQGLIK